MLQKVFDFFLIQKLRKQKVDVFHTCRQFFILEVSLGRRPLPLFFPLLSVFFFRDWLYFCMCSSKTRTMETVRDGIFLRIVRSIRWTFFKVYEVGKILIEETVFQIFWTKASFQETQEETSWIKNCDF